MREKASPTRNDCVSLKEVSFVRSDPLGEELYKSLRDHFPLFMKKGEQTVVLPWPRRLVAQLSPQRPMFDRSSVNM